METKAPIALEQAQDAAALLRIMANDRRLLVLYALATTGEQSVGHLEAVSGLSQSALSQHLAKMRQQGIVKTRRSAQSIYYSIDSGAVVEVLKVLSRLFGLEEADSSISSIDQARTG